MIVNCSCVVDTYVCKYDHSYLEEGTNDELKLSLSEKAVENARQAEVSSENASEYCYDESFWCGCSLVHMI